MRLGSSEWRDALKQDMATYKPHQFEKAIDLIIGAKFVGEHAGDYVFVSSDDSQVYLTSAWKQSCNCGAGVHDMRCYHLLAADALAVYGRTEAANEL